MHSCMPGEGRGLTRPETPCLPGGCFGGECDPWGDLGRAPTPTPPGIILGYKASLKGRYRLSSYPPQARPSSRCPSASPHHGVATRWITGSFARYEARRFTFAKQLVKYGAAHRISAGSMFVNLTSCARRIAAACGLVQTKGLSSTCKKRCPDYNGGIHKVLHSRADLDCLSGCIGMTLR